MNVDGVLPGAVSRTQQGAERQTKGMGKEDFLRLLTTQLTHQDPLNPMDNTEFVAQLAQFSSLEQMIETNKRLEMLAMSQSSLTSAAAVGFIGKEVEAWSNTIGVTGGVPGNASIYLDSNASDVTVEIKDQDGNLVRVLDLGSKQAGTFELDWDGKDSKGRLVPDGEYSLSVKAVDENGQDLSAGVKVRSKVRGVTFENGYAELILDEGKVTLADVIEMY